MATVRLAAEEDVPRILELYRQLALTPGETEDQSNTSPDNYQRAFREITALPGYALLVAEDGGEVIGSLALFIAPNLSHGARPWAIIENVIVDEAHRRCGVGRELMECALARAKEAGCCRISLDSNKSRDVAHRFYSAMGFETPAYSFRMYF